MKYAIVNKNGEIQYFCEFSGPKESWVTDNNDNIIIEAKDYINFDYKWDGNSFILVTKRKSVNPTPIDIKVI